MKCPKCDAELEKKSYKGTEVDHCPNGQGMWLDSEELDELEDKAFDEDELKGSLMISSTPSGYQCPHCQRELKKFNYRLHSLELEYCENENGFWLDAGEEERVLELMKGREKDMQRKFNAEAEWKKTLQKLRSKSFF